MRSRSFGRSAESGPPDLVMLGIVVALLIIGLFMVYSAKLYVDQSFLAKQAARIGVGAILLLVGYAVPIQWFRRGAWPMMLFMFLALVFVMLFGTHTLGAARKWHGVQPSEFAKPVLLLFLCHYYDTHDYLPDAQRAFSRFVGKPLLLCLPLVALIALQPAVSMALVCALLVFTTMLLAEVSFRQVTGALFACCLAAGLLFGAKAALERWASRETDSRQQTVDPGSTRSTVALSFVSGQKGQGPTDEGPGTDVIRRSRFQHVVDRIRAYLHWIAHPLDISGKLAKDNPGAEGIDWQQKQSWVAIGSGGVLGRGLGNGKQKFYFLPMVHTDFIFGLIGEEWGLVGSLLIFLLFLGFLWRGLFLALRSPSTFNRLLIAGLVLMVIYTAIIHLGVTLHLLPPTGQTLPFVSYGLSAMAANMFGVGLILKLSREILRRPIEDDFLSRCWDRWTHFSGPRAR